MSNLTYSPEEVVKLMKSYAECRNAVFFVEHPSFYKNSSIWDHAEACLAIMLPELKKALPREMHGELGLDSLEERIKEALGTKEFG